MKRKNVATSSAFGRGVWLFARRARGSSRPRRWHLRPAAA